MKQARRDLQSAEAQKKDGFYEWACFISQQASEKALKAALQKAGAVAWGHSLVDLLEALSEITEAPSDMGDSARFLDKYYIPARYPNGWPSGSPADYIKDKDSENATSHSEKIFQFCDCFLAEQDASQTQDR